MDKIQFIKLLRRFNSGNATKEEQQFIISYYNVFKSDPETKNLISSDEIELIKKEIYTGIQDKISEIEKGEEEPKVIFIWKRLSAAAVIIAIATAVILYYQSSSNSKFTNPITAKTPEENRFVRLPDGSTVILGPDSKLFYPSTFDGLVNREVHLEGQGFFDIKHNPEKNFIVHSGDLVTTVLGTAFNIKAFPNENHIVVSVVRGKVKVENQKKVLAVIEHDEELNYFIPDAKFIQKTLNDKTFLKWKDQDLLLDDVTFAEVAEILEDKFHIKIIFSDSVLKNNRFTTTLKESEPLEPVLMSICEFNNASFTYDSSQSFVQIRRAE